MAAGSLPSELSRLAGIDLRAYRREHVAERVTRAIGREGASDVQDLLRVLRGDGAARDRFRRSIAISVSGLFRDPEQFDLVERELLPALVADGRRLTVWSAGCADGSELYSVALLLDRFEVLERSFLLGSDLLEENLSTARRAVYPGPSASERLRSRLRWERRDLLREPTPGGKWRLILCRNVAIYFRPEAKRSLYEKLAGALAPRGILLLGRSERVARPGELGLERVGPHAYRMAS